MNTEPPLLSLILPTYNERENIALLIPRLERVLADARITYEIIVVDDLSHDGTREEVKKLQGSTAYITLVERTTSGLATALRDGFNLARGTYVGSMDTDLSHEPEEIPKFIKVLEAQQADFVIGSRYMKGSIFTGKALANVVASYLGRLVVKVILHLPIEDTSNNFRIFRGTIWQEIKDRVHPEGNVMITEIAYLAYRGGYRLTELPIRYEERKYGTSKLKIGAETVRFFRTIWEIRRAGAPKGKASAYGRSKNE
jgi:dolichol-phosphate mannosyltransferase